MPMAAILSSCRAPFAVRRKRSVAAAVGEIPILIGVAVVIALVMKAFIAQAFYIPSASMVPQLQIHDRIVVSKLAAPAEPGFRVYSDEEVDRFLSEDKLTPEAAERVRALMEQSLV